MSSLTTLQIPLPWDEFDLPNPFSTRDTTLSTGEIGWAWDGPIPEFGIEPTPPIAGLPSEGWGLDHVVLLVPNLEDALETMTVVGHRPVLKVQVASRPAAFFRVGPLLEVIESPVRAASIYGIALVTTTPLEVVALQWRGLGRDVTDPKPAVQTGRRIMTVRATEIGLAVMSPDRAVSHPEHQVT